jgi:laminin, alpha 3/5
MTGSLGYDCGKIGGQCPCKPNVIGRQCTRCKPGFFGYPGVRVIALFFFVTDAVS